MDEPLKGCILNRKHEEDTLEFSDEAEEVPDN